MTENTKIFLVVLIGIILKSISFYKYREALYLDDFVSIIIYIAIIFGDVILSRVKKFLENNIFVLFSISVLILLVMSKFDITFAYSAQCAMVGFCVVTLIFNKNLKPHKNKFLLITRSLFLGIIVMGIAGLTGAFLSINAQRISLNEEKAEDIVFQEHIEELKKELGE